MSRFYVGQRVKVVSWHETDIPFDVDRVGSVGMVVIVWDADNDYPYSVRFASGAVVPFTRGELAPAPLTDPKVGEFIERMQNFDPLVLTPEELDLVRAA